ncbi:PstS family phosphate ABC transporter substrate-binding protein [Aeoliella straminimaris]|uniref:PstS family phosphate ABC transporter substrate-binding protein n=1 Tax=Aeoliella straminimaris TaxID=2954799 RepID=UPI0020936262
MERLQRFGSLALVLSMGLAITGCRRPSSGADVQVDGSSTVYPITEAVAEEIRDAFPDIRVTVAKSGTGGGMKKFGKGEIDICDASREIKSGEAEVCKENGITYDHFMVAYDGIAVCVNPQNDWCDTLTVEQLKDIFKLDSPIKTWKDLNEAWPDEEIKLYGPGADSGTYDSFNEQVLGKGTKIRTGYTQSEEDNVLVNGIAQEKYALGYFGFAYYVENESDLKVLAVDPGDGNPIKPTMETIREKTYAPLSRPLFIYVNLDSFKEPKVQQFVKFYLDHTAALSKEVGYVPVAEEIAIENQDKFSKLTSGGSEETESSEEASEPNA